MPNKPKLMQGNEACAEGAIYAGCRFFAGYPITPSTEIAENLSLKLPLYNGVFIEMEDEIASMGAIIGASLAGSKSMTATSGPGFSLKQENIGFACLTEIPCVIVNVMRGGPSTGFPTGPSQSDVMQARWGTHGDHPIICLTPDSVKSIFYETVRAFNLAEKYRNPVILVYDEVIGHMREKFTIPELGEVEVINRIKPNCSPEEYYPYDSSKGDIPPMANFAEGYRFHVTGLNHDYRGFPTNDGKIIQKEEERLLRKIKNNVDDIIKNEEYFLDDAQVAIVAYGVSAKSGKKAVKMLRASGIKAGLLNMFTIWPFPKNIINEISKRVKLIVVPEMNMGQLVYEVERCSRGGADIIRINKVDAEPIHPKLIVDKIKEAM